MAVALLCGLLMLVPQLASALLSVNWTSVTPLGGGLYQWNYDVTLNNNSALSPGHPPSATSSYITIADIYGLVPGSELSPAGWTAVVPEPLLGYTDPGLVGSGLMDSPTVLNVEWDYTGAPFNNTSGTTMSLGTFSFTSTINDIAVGQYTSRDTKLSPLPAHNAIGNGLARDPTLVPAAPPVPTPNAAAVMLVALGSGMSWLRFKRAAAR